MDSYDGGEICELVGACILNHLEKLLDKENIGLYRDNGLAIIKNKSACAFGRQNKKWNSTKLSNNLP